VATPALLLYAPGMRILLAVLATSGLFGHVSRGPTRPVCIVGKPCSAPVVGARLEFMRSGRLTASTTTRAGGAYRIELPPGRYTVRIIESGKPDLRFSPLGVTVVAHRRIQANFGIDTGIR
jgi:hypothetical protein